MSKPHKLPSGSWRIQWFDADGKRCSASFATFELARAALRAREVATDEDLERRERIGCGALTVTEAGDRFIKNYRPTDEDTPRRFKSRKAAHERHLELHIKPHIGDVKLCDLTPPVLRRWVEKLRETRTARPGERNEDGRTLSASMIRNIVTTLRVVAKAHDVPLVVMLADSLKQKRRRRPKALQSIEDVRALVAGCRLPWFRIAVSLACYSGLRLGEIASLRWRHIGRDTITIEQSWDGPLKARYEDDEDAARVVPLAPELVVELERWRRIRGGGADDHVVMVAGADGRLRPLRENHDDVAERTRSACRRAKLAPLTFHALRASYATIAAAEGLPVSLLSAVLGHQDVRTTAIYMRPESARAALDPRARLGAHELHTARALVDEAVN